MFTQRRFFELCMALTLFALPVGPAHAALGDCGQPVSSGAQPSASDALFTLRAAVGIVQCPLSVCDVDSSCTISAADALRILKRAVGQSLELGCNGNCGGSTTTTTTSTTSTTLSGPPVWPASPDQYQPGEVSYLDTLTMPDTVEVAGARRTVATCCKDFGEISKDFIENGTNDIDNALALLAAGLTSFGVDFQAILDDSITSGDLVILLDHQGLNPASLPDEFALVQLVGAFEGSTTYTEAASGSGTFLLSRDAFVPGTGEPRNYDYPSLMTADSMSAGPFTLTLTIPFGFFSLDLETAAAEISAMPGVIAPEGVPYSDGKISGYLRVDDVFDALNAVLRSDTCACLGLTSDLYFKLQNGSWVGACRSDAATACSDPSESLCVSLAGNNVLADPPQVCSVIPSIISQQADLDLNDDPSQYEGLSIGLRFTAVGGQIVGVKP
jgi:hypothetical protein